jgi:hypothetical protein
VNPKTRSLAPIFIKYSKDTTHNLRIKANPATTTQSPATAAPPAKYLGPSEEGYRYGPYIFEALPIDHPH